MPKVSIVLPSFNGERYIRESIESVVNQTFTDWELIIVDDCSTDGTLHIAEEYARKEERIKVIHNQENQKLPEALNIGFRHASGRYLTWTSDDNMYLSRALEEMVRYLDKHKEVPMVCTGMLFMDENMQYMKEFISYNSVQMRVQDTVGACFMYRREVLADVGEYSREFFCVEDYEYWIRILIKYHSIGYLPYNFYLYRRQKNSLTIEKADRIRRMNSLLHCRYFDWCIAGIRDNPEYILFLYNQLLADNWIDEVKRNCFEEIMPALKAEKALDDKKAVVIYGAGQNGERAYECLKEQVLAFVDTNPLKAGGQKCGLPVWTLEELKKYYDNNRHQVLISVRAELQLEIIDSLMEMGIPQYAVFARIS
ncbi:MAG: glycosyltransferase [Lachnospiraceae bacterium]|nr:glycosyltransferase [Lachnospiraceae bacterium]